MRVEISRPRESSHAPTDWYDRARVPAWLRRGPRFCSSTAQEKEIRFHGWMDAPACDRPSTPFFFLKKQVPLFIFCLFRLEEMSISKRLSYEGKMNLTQWL